MKIYVDLLLFVNFAFDFILLLSVSILLHRKISINRLLFGAFAGSLSVLILFIKINSLELFLIKVIISTIMVLISFGYNNWKYLIKNILFLYMSSIILGGFLYLLNIEFSYKNNGLVFFHNGMSINFVFLIIISPIIIYIYVRQVKSLRNNYNNYYDVSIYFNDLVINGNGYVDSGNKIKDPYKGREVILIDKRKFIYDISKFNTILVPFNGVNKLGMIKCLRPTKVIVNGIKIKSRLLVGLLDNEIKIDDIDMILPIKILEEITC